MEAEKKCLSQMADRNLDLMSESVFFQM